MSNKDKCKEIMGKLFGPASASQVDLMDEGECVTLCKKKVGTFLGESVVEKEFAAI